MKRVRATSGKRYDHDNNDAVVDDVETDTKPAASSVMSLLPLHDRNETTTTTTTKSQMGATTSRGGCLQTPHTMRLLKLIRDGSPEYANMAMERLSTYCATLTKSSSSSNNNKTTNGTLVLWDLIGRLQSFLNVPIWSTRQLSSHAIYMVVAHYIPYLDQYHFFTSTIASSSTENTPASTTPPTDTTSQLLQQQPPESSSNFKSPDPVPSLSSSKTGIKEYMTMDDLLEGIYGMDNILKYGQELYSVSESQYTTTTVVTHGPVHDRHQNDNVGKTNRIDPHQKPDNPSMDHDDNDHDHLFVTNRVRQQRQILASRLGLGMMANIIVESSCNVDDADLVHHMIPNLTPDDLQQVPATPPLQQQVQENVHTKHIPSQSDTPTRKRQKYAQQTATEMTHHHRPEDCTAETSIQQYEMHVQDALDASSWHPHTIRAMLVREVQQQQQQQAVGTNDKHHLTTPQTLFGTELLYRMFHPVWYVRHGAILGILALLRAWIHTSSGSNEPPNHRLFGTWLHDLLARCVCVMALDRFGDHGGHHHHDTDNDNTNDPDDKRQPIQINHQQNSTDMYGGEFNDHIIPTSSTHSVGTSSVVAPVREVCGQAIAILHAMAPYAVAEQTRTVLFQLCEYELSWEVRHGALIALKYIVVVELTDMLQLRNTTNLDKTATSTRNDMDESAAWIETICRMAMTRLSDTSDDVKSASAHLLIELCHHSSDKSHHPQHGHLRFIWDVVPPLWSTLQKVRRFSSCIVDLVELCTLLVARNCRLFLNGLAPNDIQSTPCCKSSFIYNLIHFLVTLLDSEFRSVRTSALQSIGVVCKELGTSNVLGMDGEEGYGAAFDTLHDLALHILKLFTDEDPDTSTNNEITNFEEYRSNEFLFGTWVSICNAIKTIVKLKDLPKLDVTLLSWYFQIGEKPVSILGDVPIRQHAAQALAHYFFNLSPKCAISNIAQAMIFAYVFSPWTTHVESACLLHMALVKNFTDRGVAMDLLETNISLELPVLCLTSNVWNIATNNDTLSGRCDQVCLEAIREVIAGVKSPRMGAEHIVSSWSSIFVATQGEHTVCKDQLPTICPITEMRLMAVVAGSILVKGIPPKLTPVVRALMTFLHNETVSASRAELVATYIDRLLNYIVDYPKYSNALTKIIATLCDCINKSTSERGANDIRGSLASSILQSMTRRFTSMQQLIDLAPLWQRLRPIVRFDFLNSSPNAVLQGAMDVLEVLLSGHSKGNVLTKELILSTTPALMELAIRSCDTVQSKRAASAIVACCNVAPSCLLEAAIPSIIQELDYMNSDKRRLAACELLEKLMTCSATEICPFVRILLPRALSLMSDSMAECSKCAASIFASLIKVAPLVQRSLSEGRDDNPNGSVIDHLIFGKCLPPCTLPPLLINAMREKGVSLRNYQHEGVSWLNFLQSVNLNGALCDDMGTGKSLQALVAIALTHLRSTDRSRSSQSTSRPIVRSLIVCPSTLVGHWAAEIEKYFSPHSVFTVICLEGGRSDRFDQWRQKSDGVNIVVASYSVLRSDVDYLECEKWCYCVLDEGHLLKNPKTATSRASKRLKARHKLILTGTLIQNRVHELWATFDFLMPSFLGTSKAFTANYANPIAKSQLPNASASTIAEGLSKLKLLHQQVLPFILRREKRQVLPELPLMTQTIIKVPMSGVQRHMYGRFCADRDIDLSLELLEETFSETLPTGGSDVLKSLLFLRLLCTHPSLVLNELQLKSCPTSLFSAPASGKLLALVEVLKGCINYNDDVNGADNDESILYCDDDCDDQDAYTSVLDTPDPCLSDILQSPGEYGITRSSHTSKCIIFAQFTKSLDAVENLVFKMQMPTLQYCRLDGSVPPSKRMDVVNCFQNDPSVRVLLSTTRVGGVGLNLTSASTVIFLEVDFNPYADVQAQDRCMRIGQTQQVNVYKIITKDSIEESMLTLQDKKIQVTEAIVNNENSTMYSMGTERLLDLFDVKGEGDALEFEYDLEGIVEKCAEDYKSLTVNTFKSNFLQ